MLDQIVVGGIRIEVIRKDIKNVHLSVHPPTGRIRIAAPARLSMDALRSFAVAKVGWIRRQQNKLQQQEREPPREYIDRESHFIWGRRVLLKVIECEQLRGVELRGRSLVLRTLPDHDANVRATMLSAWYRYQIRSELPRLTALWTRRLGVSLAGVAVRQMKTKWGSCNPAKATISLNTELAKKPRECLEYVFVHELAHLIDPTHGSKFVSTMDRFMPDWREVRDLLNSLPLRVEEWAAPSCSPMSDKVQRYERQRASGVRKTRSKALAAPAKNSGRRFA